MSLRSSSSRLIHSSRQHLRRSLCTSTPALYPRIAPSRSALPREVQDFSEDAEDLASSSSSGASTSTTPSTGTSTSSPGKIRFPVTSYDGPDYNPQTALEQARQKAWYLEDVDPVETNEKPIKRQPRFTTFDPERTTTEQTESKIKPLPSNAPEALRPLYEWMISKDAEHVLNVGSVRFMRTKDASQINVGLGDIISVQDGEVGARWDWVVVAVVKGRGKGIVGRAERALRVWLHQNPLEGTPPKKAGTSNKLPRTPDWTDWSMVQIPHLGVSINLFTVEGRDRWDLESMWKEADKEVLIGNRNRPFGLRAGID